MQIIHDVVDSGDRPRVSCEAGRVNYSGGWGPESIFIQRRRDLFFRGTIVFLYGGRFWGMRGGCCCGKKQS